MAVSKSRVAPVMQQKACAGGAARAAKLVAPPAKSAYAGARLAAAPQGAAVARRGQVQVQASLQELKSRIDSVNNTKKITTAMKLVAAAKVRRAQEAVAGARPFSENLVRVLYALNQQLKGEQLDAPLTAVRPVKNVLLISCTGDRGLCGGFNNFIIKKTERRYRELTAMGVGVKVVTVGKKGSAYFNNPMRADIAVEKSMDMGQAPTNDEAQALADVVFSSFVAEECDKVELVYTRFVSLIASEPSIQTLLPLTQEGEICDVDGNCLDAAEDEIFKLTTKAGALAVEREESDIDVSDAVFTGDIVFEQEPSQLLDALLPLYMNAQILRALQESLASELAARMNAMSNASDNAKDLSKTLTLSYNKQRQAKITAELIEVVSGASAAA